MKDTIDRWMKSAGSAIQLSVLGSVVAVSALIWVLTGYWWPTLLSSYVVGSALFYWCYLVGDTDGDN